MRQVISAEAAVRRIDQEHMEATSRVDALSIEKVHLMRTIRSLEEGDSSHTKSLYLALQED